ncbi:hypothetical protein E5161_19160 [Cohnella pontilimi]|uniref:Aminoglycoside phosphotransferase domain-containing protein n=1 Tax=Cohnella pontilimi TaxID=2564100 RepID=A0A4U0F332_9BACL|nr:phosphotransferase [Cohnella pontilimi]TJY38951.1 hypothetical protein E5161_19160 [Cohnella pontilimi]
MTAYEKPELDSTAVGKLLEELYGHPVQDLQLLTGGNLSAVYSFGMDEEGCVIRFSDLAGAFRTESYISQLLCSQGVPYPRMVSLGQAGHLAYAVSERVQGQMLAELPVERKKALLPDLIELISRINHVNLGDTSGYGWIQADGNGVYGSWMEYLISFYGEDQTGNFWGNWTELFDTTFLEKDVFDECYARLMEFGSYNAPHRHFVHNDCHAWNILSDGQKITGILDANSVYGDFLIDVSIAENILSGENLAGRIREYQERQGIELPFFKERMLGARYYKGLDGLRFYAKMGRKQDYDYLRHFLLNLTR